MAHRFCCLKRAACFAMLAAACLVQRGQLCADEADTAFNGLEKPFSVQLVDVDGQPVEGADVGICPIWNFAASKQSNNWGYMDLAQSGANGLARFSDASFLDNYSLVARQADRKLMGVANVDPTKIDGPIKLTLLPESEVSGEVTRKDLAAHDRELDQVTVYVHSGERTVLAGQLDEPTFRLPLPQGDYVLSISAGSTYRTRLEVTVGPKSQQINLGQVELSLTGVAALEGQPAPEITDVRAWLNDKPVELSELRGKYVLLLFSDRENLDWLPQAINWQRQFAGLQIIGIAIDSQGSAESTQDAATQLRDWSTRAQKEVPTVREIPFPIALLSGKKIPLGAGAPGQTRATTAAQYGFASFPASVLIDRQGNVVGQLPAGADGTALLEKVLGEK